MAAVVVTARVVASAVVGVGLDLGRHPLAARVVGVDLDRQALGQTGEAAADPLELGPGFTLKVSLAPLSARTWTVFAAELFETTVASKWRTAAWAPTAKTATPSAAQTALMTTMDETRFLIWLPP